MDLLPVTSDPYLRGDRKPGIGKLAKKSDFDSLDFVHDTPNAAGPNFGKPIFPQVSCSNGPSGDMFMNYMDYVDDDSMFMFTVEQVARMHATLEGPRSALVNLSS